MPPPTTMTTLLQALRTGSTNITSSLDRLFGNPVAARANQHYGEVKKRGHFDTLDPDCVIALGVTPADITHINDWPNDRKEEVRAALVSAVEGSRPVHFSWKLSTGTREAHQIRVPATGDITITFHTPESRVRAVGTDDVKVDVGPAGPRTL